MRHLIRRPSTAIVGVLALGAGIGAATSLFALVDRILVRPLPYRDAGRLAQVWNTFPHWRAEPALGAQWDRIALAWEDLEVVCANARSIEGAGAAHFRTLQASAGADAEVRVVALGTASLLDVLGVQPAFGRWFRRDEQGPGAPRIVVASWDYWASRLGADPAAVGREVRIQGEPFTLVGVLPRTFRFPPVAPVTEGLGEAVLWQPIGTSPGDFTRNSQDYETVVRLRAGVSLTEAEAEIGPLLRADRSPERRGGRLVRRLDAVTGRARAPLLMLFGATGMLLLIACGNMALLLLGETRARSAEFATKAALGAPRSRLVHELLSESVLIGVGGGALGIALAYATLRGLPVLFPGDLPRAAEVAIDRTVLDFAVLVSIVTGFGAGLAPALLVTRAAVVASGARLTERGTARMAVGVMAAQIALSTVLLVTAILFGRSLALQTAVDPGVDAAGILALSVQLPSWENENASAAALYARALDALAGLPGVRGVAQTTRMPLSGEGGSWAVAIGPDTALTVASPVAYHEAVTPSFFDVMGIPITEGRGFTGADGPEAPRVAIVNATMARRLWPDGSPVGRAFHAPNGGRRLVVGVAADVRHHGLERPAEATFYEPAAQRVSGRAVFLLNTAADPRALGRAAAAEVRALDRDIPAPDVRALSDVLRASTADERFRVALAGTLGWISTFLAAIGIAGVALRAVTGRRRELGVRMVLGATPREAMGVVTRGSLLATGAGTAVGIPAALAFTRLFESRLYGIGPTDPVSFASAAVTLAFVAIVAVAVPAMRAARTRPAEVLRSD